VTIVIHKKYKADGAPDLRRWVIECNRCGARHILHDVAGWLVPTFPEMPDYCPGCEQAIARDLIRSAISRRYRLRGAAATLRRLWRNAR
jgi:phage terminase large subunit GpA-like protein